MVTYCELPTPVALTCRDAWAHMTERSPCRHRLTLPDGEVLRVEPAEAPLTNDAPSDPSSVQCGLSRPVAVAATA